MQGVSLRLVKKWQSVCTKYLVQEMRVESPTTLQNQDGNGGIN